MRAALTETWRSWRARSSTHPANVVWVGLVGLFALQTPLLACRCVSYEGDLVATDTVFVGTVDNQWRQRTETIKGLSDLDGEQHAATFRVERAWKGIEQSMVTVYSAATSDCGAFHRMGFGEEWLVFAKRTPVALSTNVCWGTKRASETEQEVTRLGPPSPIEALRDPRGTKDLPDAGTAAHNARAYWQQHEGVSPEDFLKYGPPIVEDRGRTWRVWALTPSHAIPPLEVEIDKQTGTMRDIPRE